jgi:hypothetical protein
MLLPSIIFSGPCATAPIHISFKKAMSQCELLETTQAIQAKARELALLLPASEKKQRETENKAMKWYWYPSPQPCYKEFVALIELMRTKVGIGPKAHVVVLIFRAPAIRIAVEKSAKSNIKSAEKSPQPTLERLDFGWLQVPLEYCVLLKSCVSDDCKEPVLQTRTGHTAETCTDTCRWSYGNLAVVPKSAYYRTKPAVPYGLIPLPISPLQSRK